MHVVFRESHGLEETETPVDLAQSPADLIVLSFSDSDLGAFAEAWRRGGGRDGKLPSLRLANLAALKHPLSVDTYVDQTLERARGILIRLIGGVPYWSYGLQQVHALAEKHDIALAVLPADGRPDPRLDGFSTVPQSTLRQLKKLCDSGGAVAAQAALAQLALAAGLYAGPVQGAKRVPLVGCWMPETGISCPAGLQLSAADLGQKPRLLITFYRSYLVAADLAPIEALFAAFRARGFDPVGLFAPSLKTPDAVGWLRRQVRCWRPAAIVNATAFSGKGDDGTSPLDVGDVPVFQVALATSARQAWAESDRGLSPADLAMHIVLPEVDGRLFGGLASFKEPGPRDPDLQFSRYAHQPADDRIDAIADRVTGWIRLSQRPVAERRLALVLSTYPGKNWNRGHAVGLDAMASATAMLQDLAAAGYDVCDDVDEQVDANGDSPLAAALGTADVRWSLTAYQDALQCLPKRQQDDLAAAWGAPEQDPDVRDGHFHFAAVRYGKAMVALQPERGLVGARDDDYHDVSRVPRHAYVAFYLWLRQQADALIHIGAHGTLEWLPGKAVALSAACWPEVLTADLPVIYPFIVNDPGEAAQAKRRIGAITLGHIPPPLRRSSTPERLARLETLLDEFSNADGLDPRRRDRLKSDIRDEAQAQGVEADLGLDRAATDAEAITRIDRFVCDIKDSQFGDGLHVWGRPSAQQDRFPTADSVAAEKQSLLAALDGRRIAAGPSGSPYRGRTDVLPTGRNLFTIDPRSVPSRAAHAQGVKMAAELVRRHMQEEGDWPRALIVDLWGSATMRTAGEDFAMALHLIGTRPVWDKASERVSGIDVLPISDLGWPRLDVTLRISGLFRDVFPSLSALFNMAVRALSKRDEPQDWNPYVGRADIDRVYGPAPGQFGVGMGAALDDYRPEGLAAAGEAWLSSSSWAIDGDRAQRNTDGLRRQVKKADSFVHAQDLPETDLLLAADYAVHEAGFVAAQRRTGGQAQVYHLDNSDPAQPRARLLPEEIARVVRGRAANPGWINGMRAHGFRGAAEIAATLEHLAAFAHLSGAVPAHLFDLYHDATLGDPAVADFLRDQNPEAYDAMRARFSALYDAGLWQTRRNSILADMAGPS